MAANSRPITPSPIQTCINKAAAAGLRAASGAQQQAVCTPQAKSAATSVPGSTDQAGVFGHCRLVRQIQPVQQSILACNQDTTGQRS